MNEDRRDGMQRPKRKRITSTLRGEAYQPDRRPAYHASNDGTGYQVDKTGHDPANTGYQARSNNNYRTDRSRYPSHNSGYGQRNDAYRDNYGNRDERPYGNRDERYSNRRPDGDNSSRYSRSGNAYPPHQGNHRKGAHKPAADGQRPKPKKKSKIMPAPKKQIKYQEAVTDPNAPIRLNKFLANAGICSRREADEFIQAGVVKVNDRVITELGTKITRADRVTFHDRVIQIESKIYVLLNKPKNCVTTSDDPHGRITVMDLVKNACDERIYPIGRLDRNTTGVLLLTNDGDLASKLTHPSFKKKKIYHVWLDKDVAIEDMQKLADGIELEDGEIHADAISYASEEDRKQVGIEIHSGRNRIVRRMFESLGYRVAKLDRVYFAGLTKKNLGRGKWRYLNEQEVNMLRMGAFE